MNEWGEPRMNVDTGVFAAPKVGKYMSDFQARSGEAKTIASMRLNGETTLASTSYFTALQDMPMGGSLSMKTKSYTVMRLVYIYSCLTIFSIVK